jgi:hypothetical protein
MSEENWKGVRLAVFKGKERFDRKYGRQRWCFKFEVQAGEGTRHFRCDVAESSNRGSNSQRIFEGCPPVKGQVCFLWLDKKGRIYRVIPLPPEQGRYIPLRDEGAPARVLKFPLDGRPMSYWVGEESAYET